MNRLTVSDIRNSRVPKAVGCCPSDAKVLAWLNEADETLLHAGLWWSSYGKFRICASSGCITLPSQMAVIEQAAQCGQPIPVHDQWFEFLDNGFGTRNPALTSTAGANNGCSSCGTGSCGLPEADHRGYFPSFDDILGGSTNTPKKLLFVCDVADDVGSTVTAMGYDGNGNWIRTNPSGLWQDGETITLAQGAGTQSTKIFSSLTSIRFPAPRKGQVWLYEYDTVATTQRLIGQYGFWETSPSYARYFIPSISTTTSVAGSCNQTMVEIIAKLDHLPLVLDSDYPIIQSIPALKFEMQARKKYEDGVTQADFAEALAFHKSAIDALESQLDHFLGQGRRMGLNIVGSSVGQNDPILSLL